MVWYGMVESNRSFGGNSCLHDHGTNLSLFVTVFSVPFITFRSNSKISILQHAIVTPSPQVRNKTLL